MAWIKDELRREIDTQAHLSIAELSESHRFYRFAESLNYRLITFGWVIDLIVDWIRIADSIYQLIDRRCGRFIYFQLTYCFWSLVRQSFSQSIRQSYIQSVRQPSGQPVSQSVNKSVMQSGRQWVSQSVIDNWSVSQPVGQSKSASHSDSFSVTTRWPVNKSVCQSVDSSAAKSVGQSVNQLVIRPVN